MDEVSPEVLSCACKTDMRVSISFSCGGVSQEPVKLSQYIDQSQLQLAENYAT